MMTLEEAKKFISGQDDLVEYCIPLVEDLVINYCNNDFTVDSTIYGTMSNTTTIDIVDNLITSGKIYIDGYGVYTIVSGTSTQIVINEAIDAVSVTFRKIRYPRAIKLPFQQLLKYHVDKRTIGLKSESVDDYSATFAEDIPKWLRYDLNKFSKYKGVV